MYKDLYQPLPDLKSYLRRIHFAADSVRDAETLDTLVFSHLKTVPFENLDVRTAEKELPLGTEALFQKIVIQNRGGFCFELNALFLKLLQALGLKAWPVMARVLWNKPFLPPYTHEAIITELEGHLWLCDVGYGGPAAAGIIALDHEEIQTIRGSRFRTSVTGGTVTVYRETPEGFCPLMSFDPKPADPVDFIPLCFHQTLSPTSFFRSKQIANIHTDTGTKSIDGNYFRERQNGTIVREIELTSDIITKNILKEEFGILQF